MYVMRSVFIPNIGETGTLVDLQHWLGGRQHGERGHDVFVLLVVPHPEEELPRHLGVVGAGDDGEGGASRHLVPTHHLLVVPAMGLTLLYLYTPQGVRYLYTPQGGLYLYTPQGGLYLYTPLSAIQGWLFNSFSPSLWSGWLLWMVKPMGYFSRPMGSR